MKMSETPVAVETAPSDHGVQIYQSDPDLFAEVGRFVFGALDVGDVAVVIATSAHLEGFETELRALGVDVDTARRQGRIIAFDAASLMAQLVVEGEVDPDAFDAVVGTTVRGQLEAGHRLRVYGEIVALLWDESHVMAALELEALWNDLGRTAPFSLMCSYPVDLVSDPAQAETLGRMCGLHSHVLEGPARPDRAGRVPPGAQLSAQFPAVITAPRAARHFVIDALRRWEFDSDLIDDAAVVVTELAANAVVHAASPFSVVLEVEEAMVRITVHDSQPVDQAHLVVRAGRGLGLLEGISLRWGMGAAGHGKAIWSELGPPGGE
jgi:anti-sigma regulatory factor (Ser/Thr protein kinase)